VLTDPDLFPLQDATGDSVSLATSWDYDTRNDRFMPSKGVFASLSYEYAGFSTLKYYTVSGSFRFFKNIFWDVVFRNSFQAAQIGPVEGRPVPFNQLYLLGGPYSLRGFKMYRVGRMKFSQKVKDQIKVDNPGISDADATAQAYRFYGGTREVMYQGELQFPLVKEAQIMGVAFYDIGAADDVITNDTLYSDVGFGIRWFSPIGPLRFEWGFPLKRDSLYQDATDFEFSIGTPF
jgi:outer membrane protein insertion porin family